jgi:hypothetical protein
MMRNEKSPIGIKTEYTLTLRNTLTGKRQSVRTHNILTTYGIYNGALKLRRVRDTKISFVGS